MPDGLHLSSILVLAMTLRMRMLPPMPTVQHLLSCIRPQSFKASEIPPKAFKTTLKGLQNAFKGAAKGPLKRLETPF